jgi:phosphohistidine phosphatase
LSVELLILRHAIAYPRDASRWPDDDERALTPEGIRRARRAATGLKRILQQAAGWPQAVQCAVLAPSSQPAQTLDVLRREGAKARCVAVVGHQPHLGRLLALCLGGDCGPQAFELKKSAVAWVRFDRLPTAHGGVLCALFPPKALRQL